MTIRQMSVKVECFYLVMTMNCDSFKTRLHRLSALINETSMIKGNVHLSDRCLRHTMWTVSFLASL